MTRQPIRTVTATAILAALTHPLASAPAAAQSDNTTIEAVTVHPPVANPETTVPGVRGQGRSSAILFRRVVDGELTDVHVAYVHVREVLVSQGDTVRAGQPVARIGNNGSSFHPHVHVGAFRGDMMSEDAVPLQVRMDLGAMGRLRGTVVP